MCICGGHKCISVPNMKFLCLTLRLKEVSTDDDDNDYDDANDNAHDGQSMMALWLINQMWQKPDITTNFR